MKASPRPDLQPGLLARNLAEEVCQRHGLTFLEVQNGDMSDRTVRARHEAITALVATGRYTKSSIARLFKVNRHTVLYALSIHVARSRPRRPETAKARHEREHMEAFARRLEWQYGPDRAAAIMRDKDPATNRDRADWQGVVG